MSLITSTYAKQYPEKLAIYTHEEKLSYRDWNRLVEQTANWFDSLQSSHKTVGMYLPNGIPFLQIFAGAAAAGWVAVPFDLKWKEDEMLKRGALARPTIWITTTTYVQKLKKLYTNVMLWEDCLVKIKQTLHIKPLQIKCSDPPFYMGFTSGSTGNPKAFIRSHQSWVESFECSRRDFDIEEKDQVLIPGNLISSHFLYGAISTLFLGGTVYLLEKFTTLQTFSFLQTFPITVLYLVPTMIEALHKGERIIETPLKIMSSGAKLEERSKQKMADIFPQHSLYEFYGASELSFVTVRANEHKRGSVGKPCHNVEIQIRNDNQTMVKPYEVGKIFVRSKMTFIGYIEMGMDSATIQEIHDEHGWVTVHDMGYLDEEGDLYLVGRENNMILYGGINIFPEEIESVLLLHPDVETAAIIGIPHAYWGQIAVAVIQGKAAKNDLVRWCKARLASYKLPRKWYFIEKMPITSGGKIARSQLKYLVKEA
ncbi:AMP-binding protein [Lederbergia sp. NSJ-179]|uniref:AMP-binding protein n=1 Tax=Lederbergia sp. NSJ-179 TaxID=2931402 RepID=UPI001FCFC6AC|nr:AMP-binding protein [Lederbergia sp. NSJ-179]MCJ7841421.1 AMP-binding protein [Lederbergia sp. NSJ-179]